MDKIPKVSEKEESMNTRRNLMGSFDQDGIHYDIICLKSALAVTTYQIQLFEGVDTWQEDWATGEAMALLRPDALKYTTPEEEVQKVIIEPVNAFLKKKFSGQEEPMPDNWFKAIDWLIDRIEFFRDENNLPAIKVVK